MFKFLKKMKKNRKGYTLTELIVVVAILGILAAVATPMVLGQVKTAKENADNANAKTIENAYKIAMTTGSHTAPVATATTASADAIAIIDDNLTPIPKPQQSGYEFYLNPTSGVVSCLASTTDTTLINLNP